jgi:hypothetical protein
LRSYIFTPAERRAIQGFLDRKIGFSDPVLRRLKYRVKEFRRVAEDVELYLRFKAALAESEAAAST